MAVDGVAPLFESNEKALYYAECAYEFEVEKSETVRQNLVIAHYYNDNKEKTIELLLTTDAVAFPYAAYWLG